MHHSDNLILNNLITRRSVRNFKNTPLKEEQIDDIIEAGLYAASGRNRQSTIILAITNKELRDEFMRINAQILGSNFDPFYNAPVIFVVLADKNIPTHLYDGPLVLGNMMNAAHALGLSSCWIHRAKEQFEMPQWQEWLKQNTKLNEDYVGIGNLAVGYIEGDYPKTTPRKEHRVFKFY